MHEQKASALGAIEEATNEEGKVVGAEMEVAEDVCVLHEQRMRTEVRSGSLE